MFSRSLFLFPACLAFPLAWSLYLHAESPPYLQAMRFAVEGRADVARLNLASGHYASTTIAALGQVVSAGEIQIHGSVPLPPSEINLSGREPAATAILRILEIPASRRGAISLRFETEDPAIRESVRLAAEFLSHIVASDWLPQSEIRIHALPPGQTRSYATGLGGRASIHLQPGVLDIDTAVHELSHHVEGGHRLILEASKRFLARRSRGGVPERLRDLTGMDYGFDETTLKANWATRGGKHYVGKFYGPTLGEAVATEVISMGLERLYRDPAGFYREDADYFLFLLLALQVRVF